jgi:succinate dehydrogenase/fumarate reductase flavoprotein subunit
MRKKFDLVAIGTGSAASTAAYACRSAGWDVATVSKLKHTIFGYPTLGSDVS